MAWNQIRVANSLAKHQLLLQNHPIYSQVNSIEALRFFMKNHCYVLLDYSSLIKSIQSKFELNAFPYFLPKNSKSDFTSDLMNPSSDRYSFSYMYNIYLNEMKKICAFTEPIEELVSSLKAGNSWKNSYERHIKDYSQIILPQTFKYVDNSIKVANDREIHKICAYFLYPIDNVVLTGFQKMAGIFEILHSTNFIKFLEDQYHMFMNEIDTIKETIRIVCGEDSRKWEEVFLYGKMAIEERLAWLDAISYNLNRPITMYEKIGGKNAVDVLLKNFISEMSCEAVDYKDDSYSKNFLSKVLGGPADIYPKTSVLENLSSICWVYQTFNEAKIKRL